MKSQDPKHGWARVLMKAISVLTKPTVRSRRPRLGCADEIKASETRLDGRLDETNAEIKASEARLRDEIRTSEARLRDEIKATETRLNRTY